MCVELEERVRIAARLADHLASVHRADVGEQRAQQLFGDGRVKITNVQRTRIALVAHVRRPFGSLIPFVCCRKTKSTLRSARVTGGRWRENVKMPSRVTGVYSRTAFVDHGTARRERLAQNNGRTDGRALRRRSVVLSAAAREYQTAVGARGRGLHADGG